MQLYAHGAEPGGGMRRRRVLRLLGVGAALLCAGSSPTKPRVVRWRGVALGAPAAITIAGFERDRAGRAIAAALDELARLEAIFSLYDRQSALVRLNAESVLRSPPIELVEVLALACRLAELTEGAFDPTVQPLWQAIAAGAPREERRAARRRVNWRALEVSPQAVVLKDPKMAVTLDGIAQGYLTDRIASVLRQHGVQRMLVDLGELRASGEGASEGRWRIAIPGGILELEEGALATSATIVAGVPRIVDPRTGEPAPARTVTVFAPEAVVADGLATALAVLGSEGAAPPLAAFPQARVIATG